MLLPSSSLMALLPPSQPAFPTASFSMCSLPWQTSFLASTNPWVATTAPSCSGALPLCHSTPTSSSSSLYHASSLSSISSSCAYPLSSTSSLWVATPTSTSLPSSSASISCSASTSSASTASFFSSFSPAPSTSLGSCYSASLSSSSTTSSLTASNPTRPWKKTKRGTRSRVRREQVLLDRLVGSEVLCLLHALCFSALAHRGNKDVRRAGRRTRSIRRHQQVCAAILPFAFRTAGAALEHRHSV